MIVLGALDSTLTFTWATRSDTQMTHHQGQQETKQNTSSQSLVPRGLVKVVESLHRYRH